VTWVTANSPLADLSPDLRDKLERLVAQLADERAPTTVRDPGEAWRVHIADSLSALEVEGLAKAGTIADVGAGAGFPGLALAIALPSARVDLIEATARKCEFMRRAVATVEIDGARVIHARSEEWAAKPPPSAGREAYDAVTARAVGRLATLAELASPLLRDGGTLVAWKGRRDEDEEAELERAAPRLAMEPVEARWVGPYAGSENRHLHVLRKAGPTPEALPRRPGIAKKRPLGAS
jgi:16S rRNA (guanine527-N7)-methyltransferase